MKYQWRGGHYNFESIISEQNHINHFLLYETIYNVLSFLRTYHFCAKLYLAHFTSGATVIFLTPVYVTVYIQVYITPAYIIISITLIRTS